MPEESIDQLKNSIMQSAAGVPLNFSISQDMKKRKLAKDGIRMLLINGLMNPLGGESEATEGEEQAPKKATESNNE